MRNEEVLQRVQEKRNILQTVKRRNADWIGHIWHRNCLLIHVIEGMIDGRIAVTGRRVRRCKQLLDDLKKRRVYWKLKEEALDRDQWRTRFGRVYGPVVSRNTDYMNVRKSSQQAQSWPSSHFV